MLKKNVYLSHSPLFSTLIAAAVRPHRHFEVKSETNFFRLTRMFDDFQYYLGQQQLQEVFIQRTKVKAKSFCNLQNCLLMLLISSTVHYLWYKDNIQCKEHCTREICIRCARKYKKIRDDFQCVNFLRANFLCQLLALQLYPKNFV